MHRHFFSLLTLYSTDDNLYSHHTPEPRSKMIQIKTYSAACDQPSLSLLASEQMAQSNWFTRINTSAYPYTLNNLEQAMVLYSKWPAKATQNAEYINIYNSSKIGLHNSDVMSILRSLSRWTIIKQQRRTSRTQTVLIILVHGCLYRLMMRMRNYT